LRHRPRLPQPGTVGPRRAAVPGRHRLVPPIPGQPRGGARGRLPGPRTVPEDGALAPIMMQQTFGVDNGDIFSLDPEGVVPDNDDTCRYNAWPYPDGPPEQQ